MAASTVKRDSSSSDDDDEELRRCREAVWETRRDPREGENNSEEVKSKRVVVAEHEHDGNELQVTQGFRAHVAKKLGSLLDSLFTETQSETSPPAGGNCADDDGEGFRLFSTSVAGQTPDDPPAPVRRRPVPSSSDSDSEMEARLKEAAVSVRDLLPSARSNPAHKKKKKKKKKKLSEGEESDSAASPKVLTSGDLRSSEQVKVKRKKKKKVGTESRPSVLK